MTSESRNPAAVTDTRAALKLTNALAVVFVALICRLYDIQVLAHPERLAAVNAQTHRPMGKHPAHLMFEQPGRGRIFDRAGRVLAESWYAHDVVMDGKELVGACTAAARRDAAGRVSLLVRTALTDAGVPCELDDVHRRIIRAVTTEDRYAVLVRSLDPDQRRRFADRLRQSLLPAAQARGKPRLRSAGLIMVPRLRRTYPWGGVTSQIVGVVGESKHDAGGRIAGRTGFERQANEVLSGRPGFLRAERDAAGRLFTLDWTVQQQISRGADVKLTIDAEIQRICMDALSRSVTERKAQRGMAVVLEVSTGEILAAVSYPTASPDLGEGESARNLNAFPIMDLYEPGSVIKPVFVAWGLDRNKLDLSTTWDCGGVDGYHVFTDGSRRRVVREYRANPGRLTTEQVLIKSSNIGAVQIVRSLGLESLWECFDAYGLSGRINIAYPYTEKARYTTQRMVANNPSYSVLNAQGSFGQGYEIELSPLGLARMYLPIAGDGTLPEPSLLKGAEPRRRPVLSPDTVRQMRSVLTRVVEEGTAKVLRGMKWSAAAKTGTAKKTGTEFYNAIICTFAPASRPEIMVTVVHKHVTPRLTGGPYTGGKVSGPVAREIVTRTLDYLQVPPDR
ncbi:MAG: penicillin-binding protein 2 [Planctomycetes bacterium]|nr:penicillin-binding protein 2 [Planctomycetota bacterium]